MASLKLLEDLCEDCGLRATRELYDKDGRPHGKFCTRHGQKALVDLTRDERSSEAKQTKLVR